MTQTRFRTAAATALAAAVTLSLAACGGGAEPGETPDATGGDQATGGEASAWILTGGGWPAIAASFERWNEANPDQQINVEEFENDAFKEKIRTSVGSGQAPTLIHRTGRLRREQHSGA